MASGVKLALANAACIAAACRSNEGRYFIVHFKELFALDGKEANITSGDIERRNTIANLLSDWGLLKIVVPAKAEQRVSLSQIKVVSFKEKADWTLTAKYNIGKKPTK